MKVTLSWWNKWFWGRTRRVFDLPACKDGYLRKKPVRTFLGALTGLVGKNIRVEGVEE